MIRRILRRAVRYAYTFLGQKEAFLYKLLPTLVEEMGDAFPELKAQQTLIAKVMKEEEDSFLRTLEKGIGMLNDAMEQLKAEGKKELDGVQAFRLFDTYGFPLDLTELICRENGFTVNEEQFNTEMQKQKDRARNAAAVENSDWVELQAGEQQFVGYDYTEYECRILRYRKVTQKKNEFYELVLDNTPFYGEMGGQVGDQGVLVSENETIEIIDTKRENGQSVHIVKQLPKNTAAQFMACVDTDKRDASAANHTATHLLDYALKQVLGDHVEQKGSFVSPDTLRFDFSHFEKVTDEQIREVERMVNDMIRQDIHIDEHDAMKKEIEGFQAQAVERAAKQLVEKAREVNGVKVITAVMPMNPAAAKDLAFKIRAAVEGSLLCVLGTHADNKPQLSIMMSDDMVSDHGLNAGQMVREAAKLIQGGGGGQPHFAQAGGKNVDGLSAAVDKVIELANL